LPLLAAAATGFGLTSSIILVISGALRWASVRAIAHALGVRRQAVLLPMRDALSFAIFVASFCGRTVFWRESDFPRRGERPHDGRRDKAHGDKAL